MGSTTKLGSWSTINKDTKGYHDRRQLSNCWLRFQRWKIRSKCHPEIFDGVRITYESVKTVGKMSKPFKIHPATNDEWVAYWLSCTCGEQSLAFGKCWARFNAGTKLRHHRPLFMKTTLEHKLKSLISQQTSKKTPNVGLGDHVIPMAIWVLTISIESAKREANW